MIKINELTKRIKNSQYLYDNEKAELLADLPNLTDNELNTLNDIFIDVDNEYEVLTEASYFAVSGLMQAFITMNDFEIKNQKNA